MGTKTPVGVVPAGLLLLLLHLAKIDNDAFYRHRALVVADATDAQVVSLSAKSVSSVSPCSIVYLESVFTAWLAAAFRYFMWKEYMSFFPLRLKMHGSMMSFIPFLWNVLISVWWLVTKFKAICLQTPVDCECLPLPGLSSSFLLA